MAEKINKEKINTVNGGFGEEDDIIYQLAYKRLGIKYTHNVWSADTYYIGETPITKETAKNMACALTNGDSVDDVLSKFNFYDAPLKPIPPRSTDT